MMSTQTIREITEERAEEARLRNLKPYVPTTDEIDRDFPPFPFPFIGDYEPEGWTLVDTHFVDTSGMGSEREPALSMNQILRLLKDHAVDANGKRRGWALVEMGQFQAYLGEFEQSNQSRCQGGCCEVC